MSRFGPNSIQSPLNELNTSERIKLNGLDWTDWSETERIFANRFRVNLIHLLIIVDCDASLLTERRQPISTSNFDIQFRHPILTSNFDIQFWHPILTSNFDRFRPIWTGTIPVYIRSHPQQPDSAVPIRRGYSYPLQRLYPGNVSFRLHSGCIPHSAFRIPLRNPHSIRRLVCSLGCAHTL